MFAPGPPHFAGRAIFRRPPQIPEQGAGIKSAVSSSSGLLIDPLLLLRRFMPLCTTLCRRGAPPRDSFYFMISQSVLFQIFIYHFILLFMLSSFCLLSSLSCSLSSCLLLSLYRFIPLYTDPHDSSFLFFCVCVLVHHAQSLA